MAQSSDVFSARSKLFQLACAVCGSVSQNPSVKSVYCVCGGIYDIRFHNVDDVLHKLPLVQQKLSVDLGQGDTPLVRLPIIARKLGIAELAVKLEFCSPTGSFKDRGSAVLVSAALEEDVVEFVEDSSGNAGASMAAYAARAGMRAHIFAPSTAAKGKLDQIQIFGAELHLIEGPRQAATDAAAYFAEENGLPYLSHALSPWFADGVKLMAVEIQQSGFDATDIVAPAGNGALLIGSHAAYRQDESPRIHCVQSQAVQPLIRAIRGETWDSAEAMPTVASGISVSKPPRASQAARAVVASGGSAVAVSDDAMLQWQRRLASEVGIFCEVTSAAAFAGIEILVENSDMPSDARVVIPITGSGLKEPLR